jgi:hypothetical protein
MSYKPNEHDWMAYLYGELEGADREKIEQYLATHPEARVELEQFRHLRSMLGTVTDKEVIAPPIFVGDNKRYYFWDSSYFKTVLAVAASLLLVMLAGKFTGTQITASGNEFKISFGAPAKTAPEIQPVAGLTPEQVQQMIASSLSQNNLAMQASWQETQKKLDTSIRQNLAVNSGKIDKLVREASTASQDQIRLYVSTLQADNMQMVKDYFKLTSSEQKDYIENLLVDFAKYLQQQRNDDLQVVQTRLNSIEQNTSVFKQETEQILSSIITTVGNTPQKETKY